MAAEGTMLPLEQEKMYMKAKNGASRESFSSFFFCSLSSIRFLIDWAGVGKKIYVVGLS